jgi:acetyl-CoA carboxylase carboxyltransferase component
MSVKTHPLESETNKTPNLKLVGDGTPQPEKDLRGAALSAYDRLEQLFDTGSFTEIGAGVHHRSRYFGMQNKHCPGDGVVCGFGSIEDRTCYAYSQDRTIMGGALGEAHAQKIVQLIDLAGSTRSPLIGINDSGGARIQEGVEALAGYGEIFKRNVRYSGMIPQISLIYGPCAGGAVYSPALTDFIIMLKQKSTMFVTGPKVVRAVTGEDMDGEALGGSQIHAAVSGVAHFVAEDEWDGLDLCRRLLGYLPNCSATPLPAWTSTSAFRNSQSAHLAEMVPEQAHKPYDVDRVIHALVDEGSFLAVRKDFATNISVGFARLGGYPVGVVANNPQTLAGVIDSKAARKAAHFVRTCNAFGLPLITLVDVPGFLPGSAEEHGGIIDHGAKLAFAYCEAQVPKISVILRKAYGGAYIVMSSKHIGGDLNFCWPGAEIAVMGAAGAVEVLYGRELRQHPHPQLRMQELMHSYREACVHPRVAIERGFIDAMIEPAETRQILAKSLQALLTKTTTPLSRRNNNIPL